MTTFTIDAENNITAFATQAEAAAASTTPFDTFSSQKQLAELAGSWPAERLVEIWNSIPGVTAVTRLKNPNTGLTPLWKPIQALPHPPPQPNPATKPTATN